jgi:hypothetical protein
MPGEAGASYDPCWSGLPPAIRSGAHVTGGGELLWNRESARQAAAWLAASGSALLGGEVYIPRGPFTAVMVDEWETFPRQLPSEDWADYVRRSLDRALEAIETFHTSFDDTERVFYFLACERLTEGL